MVEGLVNTYVVHSISFQAFRIVFDSWIFSMLLLYILWDDWPIFMISGSNEQLQKELEYTLLKPDCHSWLISKMQSRREDTLEEWYVKKFSFKFEKNATETYRMLQTAFRPSYMNRASVFNGIRDSRKAGSSGRDSVGRGQHCSNWVSGISTSTIHQSSTPSLSKTI